MTLALEALTVLAAASATALVGLSMLAVFETLNRE